MNSNHSLTTKKLNNAAVIGKGTVGEMTSIYYGIDDCYSKQLTSYQLEKVARKKFIFICLPTPTVDGKTDLKLIEDYIRDISAFGFDPIFIIRSTVPVGTCSSLAEKYQVMVVSNPEFLTEETALIDEMHPSFILWGIDDTRAAEEMFEIIKDIKNKMIITTTKTAEMVKYAINTFYALKVVYANVLYDLCHERSMNYEVLKEAIYNCKFGTKNHFDIFHKGYRGAGGKCLEKDLDSFAHQMDHPFISLINELNRGFLSES